MHWKVEGTDRETGKRKRAAVRAPDEAQARRRAERAGIRVLLAVPMEPQPAPVLAVPQRIHIDPMLAYSPHYVAPAAQARPPRRPSLLATLRSVFARSA